MKNIFTLLLLTLFFTSCNVTESIVFNKDGSGQFLVDYEMGEAVKAMSSAMGGDDAGKKKEKKGEVMDTTMVFADIMETYKDSIAALSEDKRLAMEAVKDMYMTMRVDENKEEMNFGIGLNFSSIEDLKNISEKLKQAQSLNAQNDQISGMKQGSPIGKFMGNDENDVAYVMTPDGFSRTTKLNLPEGVDAKEMEKLFDENDESNKEFIEYFKNAYYNIKLTFPKPVKSISVDNAEFSSDRKTVTYKVNWIEYIKNPLLLDVDVKF